MRYKSMHPAFSILKLMSKDLLSKTIAACLSTGCQVTQPSEGKIDQTADVRRKHSAVSCLILYAVGYPKSLNIFQRL